MKMMSLKPLLHLLRNGQLGVLRGVSTELKSFYTLTFLAAAADAEILRQLANAPATFDALAKAYPSTPEARSALEAWLQMGIRLRLLKLGPEGYSLHGLAKSLARPDNDPLVAVVQEIAELHHKLIYATLPKLKNGELWTLADQDGELIARSSRILEAFQAEVIQRTFPKQGHPRLLEIGCGSGIYLRYAAATNPSLTALALELQSPVAEVARINIRSWGLEDRIKVEQGDFRAKAPDELFDIATLYNNIYYFPVDERVALFQRISSFLKPGAFLLITTCCQGGSLGSEALNLWAATTAGAGRLPAVAELASQLREAGYSRVETTNLIPGDSFTSFQAFRG